MSVLWPVLAEQSDYLDSGGQDDPHEGAAAHGLVHALWAGTAMLLSRLAWFGDSVSLAERLAPYAPDVELSWIDEVERWLGTVGDAEST